MVVYGGVMKKFLINFAGVIFLGLAAGSIIGHVENMNSGPKVVIGDYHKYVENSEYKIKLYGADWCVFCKRLMSYFKRNNIDFTYANVEKDLGYKAEYKELKGTGYPLVIIGDALIKGYHEEAIEAELTKSGYIK